MSTTLSYIDRALIARIATGDEAAFKQLFEQQYNHIYGFVFSVVKTPALAEEITQDIFLQIWRNRASLTGIEQPDNWIFIIARNRAYNGIKQLLRDRGWLMHAGDWLQGNVNSTDQALMLKEVRSILSDAADSLPRQQAEVFRLSRMEELNLDEIAEKLQLSRNTVKYHLTKALAGVRMYLATHGRDLLPEVLFLCFLQIF